MRPSLDSALFAFSKASNGHAGWPLNVILTPYGYPLASRTYQTMAEFLDLVTRLSAKWRLQASQLQKLAENALSQWLPSTVVAIEKPGVGTSLVKQFAVVAMDAGNTVSGGFGEQAKFPSYPQLNTLLTHFDVSQDAEVKEFLRETLTAMASHGLQRSRWWRFLSLHDRPNLANATLREDVV